MFSATPPKTRDLYGDTFATLEDEVELDPEKTKLLLAALRQHHTSHIAAFQKTVAATRSVYSKRMKRRVFATSWKPLKLDLQEGPLPPTPPPTPPTRTAALCDDTDSSSSSSSSADSGGSDCSSNNDDNDDDYNPIGAGGSEINQSDVTSFLARNRQRRKKDKKNAKRRRRRRNGRGGTTRDSQRKHRNPETTAASQVTSILSVSEWLNQRRSKELPQAQREKLERASREAERQRIKAKKYNVMLPEEVRGSTANVLHVIRTTMNTFAVSGLGGQARTLYGKQVRSPRDLFRAMDRDGDGSLDHDELRAALHRLGIDMTDMQFVQLVTRVDADNSGSIDVAELEDAIMNADAHKKNAEELTEDEREAIMNAPDKAVWASVWRVLNERGIRATKLFHDIDEDWSGIITPEELREGLERLLGLVLEDAEFDLALKICDRDRSGEIEYKELARAIKYGDPDRADMTSGLPTDEEMEAAHAMHGRYSVRKVGKLAKRANQWDQIWSGGIEEIRRARRPKPLFDQRVHATQGYVKAMHLGIHSVVDGTTVISGVDNVGGEGGGRGGGDGSAGGGAGVDGEDGSSGVSRADRMARTEKRATGNVAMIKNKLKGASYHLGKMDFARLFRYYDRDNSGQIDRSEFVSLVRRDGKVPPTKMSDHQLERMFDTKVDNDGGGEVSHSEFVEWILGKDYLQKQQENRMPHRPRKRKRRRGSSRSSSSNNNNNSNSNNDNDKAAATSRAGLSKSIVELEQEERERFSKMSLMDRGGLTRKMFKLQQRLRAINPPHPNRKNGGAATFKDKKKYGLDSKDGRPTRGDPGGVLAALAARQVAIKMKRHAARQAKLAEERAIKFGREKVEVAQKRWGNLRALTKVAGIMGSGMAAAEKKGKSDDSDDDLADRLLLGNLDDDSIDGDATASFLPTRPRRQTIDPSLPRVDLSDADGNVLPGQSVVLHHPKRVLAFVAAQKRAGRHRSEALEALRKQVGDPAKANGPHAFFSVEDALVARAGICAEIAPDPEIAARAEAERKRRLARQLKKRGKSMDGRDGAEGTQVVDEALVMTLQQEAMVEEALVGIARYIHKRRARVVDVFRSIDHDGGGTIDREELEWGLKRFGMDLKDGQLDMVVRVFDADGSGNIDFKEFNAAVKYAHRLLLREVQKAKDKRAQARSDAAAAAKAKAAEKRESERRQKQHMQLAKMERDRKMKDGILEEVRAMNRPAAATIANAIVAKTAAGKKRAVAAFGGGARNKVHAKKPNTVRFAEAVVV
jgi:Ca2+-binding EF-hand superfamily protein